MNQIAKKEISRWYQHNQEKQFPIPIAIEEIADSQQKHIPNFDIPIEYQPIQQVGEHQKKAECERIKKHLLSISVRLCKITFFPPIHKKSKIILIFAELK